MSPKIFFAELTCNITNGLQLDHIFLLFQGLHFMLCKNSQDILPSPLLYGTLYWLQYKLDNSHTQIVNTYMNKGKNLGLSQGLNLGLLNTSPMLLPPELLGIGAENITTSVVILTVHNVLGTQIHVSQRYSLKVFCNIITSQLSKCKWLLPSTPPKNVRTHTVLPHVIVIKVCNSTTRNWSG